MGIALINNNKYEEGIEHVQKALEMDSTDAQTYQFLAFALSKVEKNK